MLTAAHILVRMRAQCGLCKIPFSVGQKMIFVRKDGKASRLLSVHDYCAEPPKDIVA